MDENFIIEQYNLRPDARQYEQGEYEAFGYLDMLGHLHPDLAQEAMQTLNTVLDSIDYSLCNQKKLPHPDIVVHLNMPLNVGGYFRPGTNYIAINPITLLYATKEEIFRVIQHEVNHYSGILDESATDLLAELQMEERGINPDTNAGYFREIQLLKKHLPSDITAKEILELVTEDDQETLCNFIEKIIISKLIEQHGFTDPITFQHYIEKDWHIIQELFPRLVNTLLAPEKNLHTPANDTHISVELTNLLGKRYIKKCLELENQGYTVADES